MNTYLVRYKIEDKNAKKIVESENLFLLVVELESRVLYKDQFSSIYEIKLIE